MHLREFCEETVYLVEVGHAPLAQLVVLLEGGPAALAARLVRGEDVLGEVDLLARLGGRHGKRGHE